MNFIRTRYLLITLLCGTLPLYGCLLADKLESPAILTTPSKDNAAQKKVIETALSQLLYAPVTVSDSVFSETSVLLLQVHGVIDKNGNPIDDGNPNAFAPEKIMMIKQGNTCYLQRQRTGEKAILVDINCHAIAQ